MNAADLANIPVFPTPGCPNGRYGPVDGATLRQYYAGKFMAALLSCPETNDTAEGFAESAVIYTDLLIAELAKQTNGGAA